MRFNICKYDIALYRDTIIPEERFIVESSSSGSVSKSLPKREQQYIIVKTSPKSRGSRNNGNNQQTRGLLSHSSDSDDVSDSDAKGKLMKQQPQPRAKKNFSVGSDDDDDEESEMTRMKRS